MKTEPRDALDETFGLRGLTATWEDLQRSRLAAEQRGLLPVAAELHKMEGAVARQVGRALAKHPLADWLPKGLRGVHVARLIALIDDPWRFPGRRCTVGHYLPVAGGECANDAWDGDGGPCPVETYEGPCPGTLLPPRPGTGVRSLWHYCGLHAVDGRSPRKRKGQVADWNPTARTIVLMPGGIAEQIVRQKTPVYRDLYDGTKDRLSRERGAAGDTEVAIPPGLALTEGPEVDDGAVGDMHLGLRPFQIDAIARKVAAKAFLGDLLMEWKRRTAATASENETQPGRPSAATKEAA